MGCSVAAPGEMGGVGSVSVSSDEQWLAAVWPFVRGWLPSPPVSVVEIGCGPLGGFVPMLEAAGYAATGVDPEAPSGPAYRQDEFERSGLPGGLGTVIACTSLHHVAGLGEALDRVHALLEPGGVIVVVEWAREHFDEATARWCFGRLPEPDQDHLGWLHERQAEWAASGQSWDACLRSRAEAENMHTGQAILDALETRFRRQHLSFGPYFFADLAEVSEADEQAAIGAGLIRANRINYIACKDSARRH
jgi:SAM-dependent methyltransferase